MNTVEINDEHDLSQQFTFKCVQVWHEMQLPFPASEQLLVLCQ